MTHDRSGGRSLGAGAMAGLVAAALATVLLVSEPASARPRKPKPAGPAAPVVEFNDDNVKAAIDKAAAYLWKLQLPDGSFPQSAGAAYPDGPTAVIVYALLESGVKPFNKQMEKALTWLERQKCTKTYSLGLRCQAWHAAIRQKGPYRATLKRDSEQLYRSTSDGGYGYDSTGKPATGDRSCSQYGLLGVWAASLANLEIPGAYWQKVMKFWVSSQCADGGWLYNGTGAAGTPSMSAAGVASLFVCFDNIYIDAFNGCNPSRAGLAAQVPIQKGLEWFDKHIAGTMGGVDGYYLYGVERIGLASGYKYFGTTDWYRTGAKLLLKSQAPDGSWSGGHGGPPVSTAQCMLFLIRGRQPVIFNKLQHDGDWNNRPRDLAMMTRWLMTDIFEHEVFWQIINMKTDPSEWHDAPVLYIAGAKKPKFSEAELEKLRTYVGQGGTILSVTECGSDAFEKGMMEVYRKLFPDYEIREAPLTHELYRIHQDLSKSTVKFMLVSNGVRPLAIHVSKDMARAWQMYNIRGDKWAFQAALNIYLHSTEQTLPPRGSRTWPAASTAAPEQTVKAARVKFAGNWNPEPLAFERFSRLLLEREKVKVEWTLAKPDELPDSGVQVATLSGTGDLRLSAADGQALKKFVDAGGTLVIDAAGGDKKFGDSALAAIRAAFGPGTLERVTMADPLMTVEKIDAVKYRKKTAVRMRGAGLPLLASAAKGPGRVIFSFEDITVALVGFPCTGCNGYDPETAYEILRNAMLLKQAKEAPATQAAGEAPAIKDKENAE